MAIGNLDIFDLSVIAVYFIALFALAIWASCQHRGSIKGYFLAGRDANWLLVGASLWASNISSVHFLGLAGAGAKTGIGVAAYELGAVFVLILLGWIFLPIYLSSGVYTMPEYLRLRFGGRRLQIFYAVLSLLLSLFTKISADIYAGAVFVNMAANISLYPAVIFVLVVAAIFTVIGGLTTVMWTDLLQTCIMITGAIILAVISVMRVGGYDALYVDYMDAKPNTTRVYEALVRSSSSNASADAAALALTQNLSASQREAAMRYGPCGVPDPLAWHLVRPASDSNFPWPGTTFGILIGAIWYWCADQVIVQRALAAKNLTHGQLGCSLTGYLKLTPLFLIIIPGMIARVLFTDDVACVEPNVCKRVCDVAGGCTDTAYPLLILRLLPSGLRGVLMAVAFSSLIASLASIFNSSSTIFTLDIWQYVRSNKARQIELLVMGRVSVVVLLLLSVAWIPFVVNAAGLFTYVQMLTSYLACPLSALFLLAVFWPRFNEQGAFWGVLAGLLVGGIRFVAETLFFTPVACGDPQRPYFILTDSHFLYYRFIIFFASLIVMAVVSMLTDPLPDNTQYRLTFWNRFSSEQRQPSEPAEELESEKSLDGAAQEKELYGSIGDRAKTPEESTADDSKAGLVQGPNKQEIPLWKRVFLYLCGIEHVSVDKMDDLLKSGPLVVHVETTADIRERLSSITMNACEHCVSISAAVGACVLALALWIYYR